MEIERNVYSYPAPRSRQLRRAMPGGLQAGPNSRSVGALRDPGSVVGEVELRHEAIRFDCWVAKDGAEPSQRRGPGLNRA